MLQNNDTHRNFAILIVLFVITAEDDLFFLLLFLIGLELLLVDVEVLLLLVLVVVVLAAAAAPSLLGRVLLLAVLFRLLPEQLDEGILARALARALGGDLLGLAGGPEEFDALPFESSILEVGPPVRLCDGYRKKNGWNVKCV